MINTSLALQIYFDTGDLGARNDPFHLVNTINFNSERLKIQSYAKKHN